MRKASGCVLYTILALFIVLPIHQPLWATVDEYAVQRPADSISYKWATNLDQIALLEPNRTSEIPFQLPNEILVIRDTKIADYALNTAISIVQTEPMLKTGLVLRYGLTR